MANHLFFWIRQTSGQNNFLLKNCQIDSLVMKLSEKTDVIPTAEHKNVRLFNLFLMMNFHHHCGISIQ